MKRTATLVSLVLGTGLVAGLAPAPAFADTTTTTKICQPSALAAVKAHSAASVSRRDATLDELSAKLGARPAVTAAHRATLNALYASDKAGLDGVNAKVQGDTTCKSAHDDAQAIVADYRVYLLVVPQSRLTLGADTGTAGAKALAATEPALQKAIALLPDGPNKDRAMTLYADMAAQVDAAENSFDGVAATVLALTPAGYPANAGTLQTEKSQVASGGHSLAKAASDAEQLATLLS